MIIYKATNKVNGKSYIGKSINPLEVRRNQHIKECKLNRSNSYFHKALLKYGCDQFDWFVIHECGDISTLNDLEISMINEHNTLTPNGYNLTTGGEGITGYKHTDKTKQKLIHYTKN
ncbi:MAG: GIY-YIG nuclease family protein, partial [Acholeplasmataceae bacterium]|nr:GIY-YIG nuclease family protein [Acholeplasmataceae bacterium]